MSKTSKLLFPLSLFCSYANAASPVLINGNFEAFNINEAPYNLPYDASTNPNGYSEAFTDGPDSVKNYRESTTGIGWQTAIADPLLNIPANNVIEIWTSGFQGISSTTGSGQFAELNANTAGALFQDVTIAEEGDVDYSFSHVNRRVDLGGTDVMKVLITYLGPDDTFGTIDDIVKESRNFSTTNTSAPRVWTENASDNVFRSVAGGTYRFSFGAVSTVGDDLGTGNFIDNVRFGLNVVPEPSAALLGSLGALALLRRRRR